MQSTLRNLRLAVPLVVLTSAGCGAAGGLEVSGRVTLDNQPLDGNILFQPLGEGRSAGGRIAGGRFSLAASDGPQAGVYRVEIVSFRPSGRQRMPSVR